MNTASITCEVITNGLTYMLLDYQKKRLETEKV